MGGKQSSEETQTLEQKTAINNALRMSNSVINTTVTEMIDKKLQSAAAGAVSTQKISLSGLRAVGDVNITNLNQLTDSVISVSAIQDSQQRTELANDLTQDLKTKLKNVSDSTQAQLDENGEQLFAELVGAIGDTVQTLGTAATGTDVDSKKDVTIRSALEIENETELNTLIENSVQQSTVNEAVTQVASTMVGGQELNISDVEAGGSILIADVNQEIVQSQILESLQKSDLSKEIISKMTNISQTEVESATKTDLKQTQVDASTLKDAGEAAKDVLEGTGALAGTFLGAITQPLFIIAAIVSVIVVMVFIIYISSGGESSDSGQGQSKEELLQQIAELKNVQSKGSGRTQWGLSMPEMILFLFLLIFIVYMYFKSPSPAKEPMHGNPVGGDRLQVLYGTAKIGTGNYYLSFSNPLRITTDWDRAASFWIVKKGNKVYFMVDGNYGVKFLSAGNQFVFDYIPDHCAYKDPLRHQFEFQLVPVSSGQYLVYNTQFRSYLRYNPCTKAVIGTPNRSDACVIYFAMN